MQFSTKQPNMALFSTIILLLVAPAVLFSPAEATTFSTDLIHRDHPKSALHKPAATSYERQREAIVRSFSRAKYLKTRISNAQLLQDATPESIESVITAVSGEYLMEVAVGTPPFTIQAIADTGSDLTWTQCSSCTQCYNQTAPLFKPSNSKSHRKLTCDASPCQDLQQQGSCDDTNHCQYQYSYGDSSSTSGDLAADILTFQSSSGGKVSVPTVAIGCGFNNRGAFQENGSGIIGLGGGSISIIRQMDKLVKGKFSYCLVDPFTSSSTATSKISFGPAAVVSGVSTPLINKVPNTFYFVTLEGFSVQANSRNATAPPKKSPAAVDPGNIILDSGAMLTLLPEDIYSDLASEVQKSVSAPTAEDPQGQLTLCFQASATDGFPNLAVHFAGADVVVPASSAFIQVSDGVTCLAFVPSSDLAIFGNLSQQNFAIGYDLQAQKVSFKPTDCSKTQN